MKIPFNKPFQSGKELTYIQEAIHLGKISGNGEFTHRCQDFFEQRYGFEKCLLTTSCTDALEMAAILLDIQPGDEVILPSFTFVSTANAFVLRGAKPIFVDSKADHPNMDETLVEALITSKTKAIVVVHYGGVACEMGVLMDIATRHGLLVVEDAAQAIDQYYQGKPLGSIGHLGAFSFHETKNIQCGEGGMLCINDPSMISRAEMIWEKGTDRAAYFRGEIDKYGWRDIGSSFLPSELNAAYLYAQLENLDKIQSRRKSIWEEYHRFLSAEKPDVSLLSVDYLNTIRTGLPTTMTGDPCSPFSIPDSSIKANAHIFYLLFPSIEHRMVYAQHLKGQGILAVFHYQSLHKSRFIQSHLPEQFSRALPHADRFSDCLLRLPLFYELPEMC